MGLGERVKLLGLIAGVLGIIGLYYRAQTCSENSLKETVNCR